MNNKRAQHNNRDMKAERSLTYTVQVSSILIPKGHANEASGDASLHRLRVACTTLRGKYGASLLHFFRDSLSEIYENILALDSAEVFQVREDY
jgi:hypothetical protein